MKTLKDLFLMELADIYDAEQRIAQALPKIWKAATCTRLQALLQKHLKETETHVAKVEQVFKSLGKEAKGMTCDATVGLLKEADEIATAYKGSPAVNAALICVVQKVEHHEIASYGCLHEWANMLEHQDSADILNGILDQEKAVDDALTVLARAGNNEDALNEKAPEKKAQDAPSSKSLHSASR